MHLELVPGSSAEERRLMLENQQWRSSVSATQQNENRHLKKSYTASVKAQWRLQSLWNLREEVEKEKQSIFLGNLKATQWTVCARTPNFKRKWLLGHGYYSVLAWGKCSEMHKISHEFSQVKTELVFLAQKVKGLQCLVQGR